MKKKSAKRLTSRQHSPLNSGTGSVSTIDIATGVNTNGDDRISTDAFVTILQDLLRNVLPRFEPLAMMEFRTVLEREITSALEAKGVCECSPDITTALKQRRARIEALKEYLNEVKQVSDLNDIKRVANCRIKMLTKGSAYTRKMIKGREYLYEVYWEPTEKKKKYKYIGPAPLADGRTFNSGNTEQS